MGSCVSHYSRQVQKEVGVKERVCTAVENVLQPPRLESTDIPIDLPSVATGNKSLGVPNQVDVQAQSTTPNTYSPTYTNLGLFRVNMTPLKKPRNPNISERSLDPVNPARSDEDSGVAPPLLPKKKTTAVSAMDPSAKGQDSTVKSRDANLSVINPLYSTWDPTRNNSSQPQSLEQKSQNTLSVLNLGKGRPANSLSCLISSATPSFEADRRGTRSTESLLSSSQHSARGRVPRPETQPLYKGMENWEEMGARIRRLHRDMLRKLAGKCEERFTAGRSICPQFSTDDWSDFRLTDSKPCCEAGDAFYYPSSYAKDPHVTYAIKVCKGRTKDSQQQLFHSLAVRQVMDPHFNIQQDCGHFLADLPTRLLPWEEGGKDRGWSGRGHGQPGGSGMTGSLCSRMVVITPEVPFQTAADFVQEGLARHGQNPELYERQVCMLLLQICQGLEHAKMHQVTHCNLRLENLLLVHCRPCQPPNRDEPCPGGPDGWLASASSSSCPARLLISNFAQAKMKSQLADPDMSGDWARFAPEIIAGTQYRKCDEFQTGILIYEMLHLPNPFEKVPELRQKEYTLADLPPLPARSLYSKGLQPLALLLLRANPSDRIEMADARAYLQCLLWGPREDLFQALAANSGPPCRDAILQSWLDLKQTLMMIKFAERSLDTSGGVSLEDWLCCQYLAFSTTDSLSQVVGVVQNAQR